MKKHVKNVIMKMLKMKYILPFCPIFTTERQKLFFTVSVLYNDFNNVFNYAIFFFLTSESNLVYIDLQPKLVTSRCRKRQILFISPQCLYLCIT